MVDPHSASPGEAAEALAAQGRVGEAYELLQRALAGGDAQAAATLAQWRITGQWIRRDIAKARALYARSGELGLQAAEAIHIALLANGAGGAGRDWPGALKRLEALARHDALARRQSELIAAMSLDSAGDPLALPPREELSQAPRITVFRGFMSADECRYLADQALPMLQPAIVIHPQTRRPIHDPVRTAHSTGFPFVDEDPALHALNRRIMAATATSYEQGEPIQVLSYQGGQEYKLHSDCLPPGSNQRAQTFLVTLSGGFAGGETSFPRIGLDFRGEVGDAVHFVSVTPEGAPDPLAWHAGKPVTRGRKLLLSKWIREAPLDLSGPPGRPF